MHDRRGGKLRPRIKDDPLYEFSRTIRKDGVGALRDEVHRAAGRITTIAIGPLETLSAAQQRDPSIAAPGGRCHPAAWFP